MLRPEYICTWSRGGAVGKRIHKKWRAAPASNSWYVISFFERFHRVDIYIR